MNPHDEFGSAPSPARAPVASPVPAPAPWATERALQDFARDYLKDRRSERRWRVFFRLAWLLFVIALAWAIISARTLSTAPSGPHTALVEVRGEIAADTPASAEALVAALKAAFEDAGSQALVLRFTSD